MAARFREYASPATHDNAIIKKLQQQVGGRDVLYILGDVADDLVSLMRLYEVDCRKVLVKGNHDTFALNRYTDVFEDIHGLLDYKGMWLSHCPIHPQEMFRKRANIHGHIHSFGKTGNIKFPYVNWDFWNRAVNLDEIRRML